MSNTPYVTGGKSIAIWSQSVLGVDFNNLLVAFYDDEERERCNSFILSWTPRDKTHYGKISNFYILFSLGMFTYRFESLNIIQIALRWLLNPSR
jgi:hypothetical protein